MKSKNKLYLPPNSITATKLRILDGTELLNVSEKQYYKCYSGNMKETVALLRHLKTNQSKTNSSRTV